MTLGELAIIRKFFDCIIHIAATALIGQVFCQQNINQMLHIFNMFGRTRFYVGRLTTQKLFILMHSCDEAVGQLGNGLTVIVGSLNNFIVNIRNISYIINLIANGSKPAYNDIKAHHDSCMTHMAVVINCHTTHINPNLPCMNRFKWALAGT